jgi:hypothetical protein
VKSPGSPGLFLLGSGDVSCWVYGFCLLFLSLLALVVLSPLLLLVIPAKRESSDLALPLPLLCIFATAKTESLDSRLRGNDEQGQEQRRQATATGNRNATRVRQQRQPAATA